jgi:cytochrome c-type biogenesis protein CcmH
VGLGPIALLVVLGVALLIGSGVFHATTPTASQRAAALETQIRCPSCEDVSVADSSASSAQAVRRQILVQISAGESDQQIEDSLVARYGPTILLAPPARGLTALVWIIPAAVALVALGLLGALFWRRTKEMDELRRQGRQPLAPTGDQGPAPGDRP